MAERQPGDCIAHRRAVGLLLSYLLTAEQLESFGWRIAFGIGAIVLPFGLLMRRRLPETLHHAEVPSAFPSDRAGNVQSRATDSARARHDHEFHDVDLCTALHDYVRVRDTAHVDSRFIRRGGRQRFRLGWCSRCLAARYLIGSAASR